MDGDSRFKDGYTMMLCGWKLTIQTPRHIKIEHPVHTDVATLVEVERIAPGLHDMKIEYEFGEKVPRVVRAGVKILFRKVLARGVQYEQCSRAAYGGQ